ERRRALDKLLPYQRDDFKAIFKAMKGFPVTIRTLDPPLHEFLPHGGSLIRELAEKIRSNPEKITARIAALTEANPMLGHRGCRLGVVYPEITEMQARAIFEAAAEVQKSGTKVAVEVMVPLVGFPKELDNQTEIIRRVAAEVEQEKKVKLNFTVGTMIEIPRAALIADEIAQRAEFFSFGTNDLTQTTLGMSRDDSASFLPSYQELEIVKANPFASIDQHGVGKLMKFAIDAGRSIRKDIKLGICGEHGGDPDSVKFCHQIGLSYVSCSPFRVPIARLAAAQAALAK
ncbi:MAG: pyruvate, phosphate dikinase, partial [Verrucomicrobiae bacterium]|nr:pyruvate, phosphate dikinase [Verrucomicrobiae bacterium]